MPPNRRLAPALGRGFFFPKTRKPPELRSPTAFSLPSIAYPGVWGRPSRWVASCVSVLTIGPAGWLAAVADTSISGRRVARELTALVARRGKPGLIVSDHGTEFTSNAMLA